MERNIIGSLLAWKDKKERKPLLLRGARQVGKTYSLKDFGTNYFPRFHYLNFEEDAQLSTVFERDLNPHRIIEELSFYLDSRIDIKNDFLIFDEIQECPRAITSFKYFSETMPELALCGAGSLLGVQLSDASFPVGKVDFLNLFPMSFEEFLLGIEDVKSYDFLLEYKPVEPIPEIIHSHLWRQLLKYFVVGGLPEVVKTYRENKDDLFNAFQLVRKVQNNLILAYMADMAKHSGKQNSMHIERLWRNVPAQLARSQDGSAPKFKFKGVIPGIKGFSRLDGAIDWLSSDGLLIKTYIVESGLLPFSAYAKENFFKLYLFDVGILGAIGNLAPKTILEYEYGTYKGYFAENFAAQEFIYSGVDQLFCWKKNTAEVEFLREVDGCVFPVEIKSGWVTQSKSLKVFAAKYNPEYRTIMSARNVHIDPVKRLRLYPLYLAARFPFKG